MVEELVDVEYISLHGYIRNTPSDTEVHAEHQLRVDRRTWPVEKNIETHTKLSRMKELGGKTGVLVGLDHPQQVGELKQGSNPHIGAIVWVRGETFKAESETTDMWQPRWNENQTVLAAAIQTLDRVIDPLEGTEAGSWSLGVVEQSQGKGCCWLQRDGLKECEGGDCGGKCLWRRKVRQPWKQGDTAESYVVDGAITTAPLPQHASIGS